MSFWVILGIAVVIVAPIILLYRRHRLRHALEAYMKQPLVVDAQAGVDVRAEVFDKLQCRSVLNGIGLRLLVTDAGVWTSSTRQVLGREDFGSPYAWSDDVAPDARRRLILIFRFLNAVYDGDKLVGRWHYFAHRMKKVM
jgi:hypothetical protein